MAPEKTDILTNSVTHVYAFKCYPCPCPVPTPSLSSLREEREKKWCVCQVAPGSVRQATLCVCIYEQHCQKNLMRKRTLILGAPIGLLRDSKSNWGWHLLFELFFEETEPKRVVGFPEKRRRDC
jgi:hypothetical protein